MTSKEQCEAWVDLQTHDGYKDYDIWQAAQADQAERVKELEVWKDAAIQVESEWDDQAVGKALNIELGKSIRANILPKIAQLQADNAKLREALEVCKYDCNTGEVIGIAKEALGETK